MPLRYHPFLEWLCVTQYLLAEDYANNISWFAGMAQIESYGFKMHQHVVGL